MDRNLEIFEIAPTPSKYTIDLLKKIYGLGGPVEAVYKKYHIKYQPLDFFVLVNGQLWIDKDIEKRTLPLGVGNILALAFISLNNYRQLFDRLGDRLNSKKPLTNVSQLLDDYQLVFEIDFLFAKAVKNLEAFMGRESSRLSDLLSFGQNLIKTTVNFDLKTDTSSYVGNSLEIGDTGKFVSHFSSRKPPEELEDWWRTIPEYRRVVISKSLDLALIYSRLREYGRWLVVKNISQLRRQLPKYESAKNKVQSDVTTQVVATKKISGVSAGVARGILADVKSIRRSKQQILFTRVLSPNLTDKLDEVVGVVATNGSITSHLAIVAREMGVPVLVGVQLDSRLKLGDMVEIDGSVGSIKVID